MKKLRRKFLILLTIFIVFMGFGSWLILIHFFPSFAFYDYPLIPLFFYTVGILSIYILTGLKAENSSKLLNTFMLIRGIKMFFALAIATVYWLLDRAEIRSFAIMLVAFYLCYLFLETYIYIQIETWNKKNLPPIIKKKNEDKKV